MKRCSKCGSFQGSGSECFSLGPHGPEFGNHLWEEVSHEAPGPEYWQNLGESPRSQPRPQPRPDFFGDPNFPPQLLDSRPQPRTSSSKMLLAQKPIPRQGLMTADVRNALFGTSSQSWHQRIIQECAPICRALRSTEPKKHPKLPCDVRSRGTIQVGLK